MSSSRCWKIAASLSHPSGSAARSWTVLKSSSGCSSTTESSEEATMSFDTYGSSQEPRDIWLVTELAEGKPTPLTLEMIGGARTMADSLGCYVHAVVLGSGLGELPDLVAAGADRVHVADDSALAELAVEPY